MVIGKDRRGAEDRVPMLLRSPLGLDYNTTNHKDLIDFKNAE